MSDTVADRESVFGDITVALAATRLPRDDVVERSSTQGRKRRRLDVACWRTEVTLATRLPSDDVGRRGTVVDAAERR